ncbi:sulfite exporter TauE/SafE family protein [Ferribacterium limneticum]|uniref:sulfite exporter TauE/SafE family protein n=1 Tax=Ferribacterium limneticum TaxID=76259 RepID=UPI001CFABEDB|nr:sulfite exporter TauE/SafE family protein [Ferribacterium limneticum]UCV27365.1 sulfite exporter TauE/SafE family protein [Ferribacterium limneticum]UCV31282.1 sulfite exporter TauE/SafE family protein [Ferribacterium limneticum]
MPDSGYLALFLVGLLGGTHCVGMCGGIVGALSMGGTARWSMHFAYNGGRILSYAAAGAIAGALGAASMGLEGQVPARLILYFIANLMLVAMGLYLLGVTKALALTERAGQSLWRRLQPLTRRFLPVRSVVQAFPLGVLWGWLPCGLVYSALATALSTGSAGRGALTMLAFGLGTLPNLLLAGIVLARLNEFVRRPIVRTLSGLLVLGFGLYGFLGLMRLSGGL